MNEIQNLDHTSEVDFFKMESLYALIFIVLPLFLEGMNFGSSSDQILKIEFGRILAYKVQNSDV